MLQNICCGSKKIGIFTDDMERTLDNMHLLVVHMGRKRCGAEWNYANVCSPFMRIYYILSGEAEIGLADGGVRLEAGRMYLIPAFTPHSCHCRHEFEHYYVHLYNESAPYVLDDWRLPPEVSATGCELAAIERLHELCPGMELVQTDPRAYDNALSLAERIGRNKGRELWARMESRGLIYVLLSRFMQGAVPRSYVGDSRVGEAVAHIRSHLSSPPDIGVLAGMAKLSADHFIRLFRKETGQTPLQYINARRIEAAQLKLLTEQRAVKEIAYGLGFEDAVYFHRLFRKLTGQTPRQYRMAGGGLTW